MTEQQQAGPGGKTVPAKKGNRLEVETPAAPPLDHNRRASATDDRLRLLIERIERLEEEKKGIGDDIKDVYSEAKSTGYNPKIMRMVVRLRKKKPDDLREQAALLETYANALSLDAQMVLL